MHNWNCVSLSEQKCIEKPAVSFSVNKKPQIPPLRFAPVGMTRHFWFGMVDAPAP